MKIFSCTCLFIILSICASVFPQIYADYQERVACTNKKSPCFLKSIACPTQCPSRKPKYPKAKAYFINCDSPIFKAECRNRKPSCNGVGAACFLLPWEEQSAFHLSFKQQCSDQCAFHWPLALGQKLRLYLDSRTRRSFRTT